MLRVALTALFALVLVAPGHAQAPPDAQSLLQRTGDAYRALSSYHVESLMDVRQVTGDGPEQTLQAQLVMAGDRSGRVRLEVRHPQAGALVVSDGRLLSTYMAQLQQYTQKPAPPRPDSAGVAVPPQGSPLQRYFALPQGVRSATVEGAEALEVGGQSRDCWRVRCDVTPEQALAADSAARAITFLWLDRANGLVQRDSTVITMHDPASGTAQVTTRTLRITHQAVDTPPPDSVFVFTPPLGAKLVSAFGPPQSTALSEEFTGKPAPDFTLTGVKGSTVSLARVNEALPDSLLAFVPPAGAVLVQAFGPQGGAETPSPLVGKPAPPFTLKGVKGSTVSLAAYKGKVVLSTSGPPGAAPAASRCRASRSSTGSSRRRAWWCSASTSQRIRWSSGRSSPGTPTRSPSCST
jgi:outer membrane lipoprotein-sorting protein